MLQLKHYVSANGQTFDGTILGTVKEVTKGLKVNFLKANWADTTKRVVIVVRNANNESATMTCSTQVSNLLRSGKLTIPQMAGCQVFERKDGAHFIGLPGNTGFSFDGVEVEDVQSAFLPA